MKEEENNKIELIKPIEPVNPADLLVKLFFAIGEGFAKALISEAKQPRRKVRRTLVKSGKRRATDKILDSEILEEKEDGKDSKF